MSLEQQIEELNVNLKNLVVVIASLTSAAFSAPKAEVLKPEIVDETKSTPMETEKKAPAAKKEPVKEKPAVKKDTPAAKKEPEPEFTDEEADAILDALAEVTESDSESGLPAGLRNLEYFNAHLRPLCGEILKIDGSKLKAIARKFGCERISDTKPEDWDAIYAALNEIMDTANAEDSI